MKVKGDIFSRQAVTWALVVLSATFLPRADAAFDCSTELFKLTTPEFENWINSMKTPAGGITTANTSACANQTLEDYPELTFTTVTEGSDDALVRYVGSLTKFMDLITGDEFDPTIGNKVKQVRATLTAEIRLFLNNSRHKKAKLRDLVVANALVDSIENTISGNIDLGEQEIASFSKFHNVCEQGNDRAACDRWEKSLRLILATSSLLNHFKPSIISEEITWFKQALSDYSEDWDEYFRERKMQLPWEMGLNQIAHRDQRKNDFFSRPPKFDWVVLHPALVASLNSDESGSEDELDLVLEIFGINYWKAKNLSGVSLVNFGDGDDFLDKDRYGIMFHFGSQYAVGWADNEDDGHWFVSIDLLARFDDERKKLKQREQVFKTEWNEAVDELK